MVRRKRQALTFSRAVEVHALVVAGAVDNELRIQVVVIVVELAPDPWARHKRGAIYSNPAGRAVCCSLSVPDCSLSVLDVTADEWAKRCTTLDNNEVFARE